MSGAFLLCCYSLQPNNEKLIVAKSKHYSQAQAVLLLLLCPFYFDLHYSLALQCICPHNCCYLLSHWEIKNKAVTQQNANQTRKEYNVQHRRVNLK